MRYWYNPSWTDPPMIFDKRNIYSLEQNLGDVSEWQLCGRNLDVNYVTTRKKKKKKKKKKWNKTYTTLKHVSTRLIFSNWYYVRRIFHVQHILIFGMFLWPACKLFMLPFAKYPEIHIFIFRILLSYEFSLKDAWLVLYTSNSLFTVLFKSAIEFPVAVILFEICSVGKAYPHTERF